MTERLIANTNEPIRHPWPEDCMVQGGPRGVVVGSAGAYRTAFVEAFPGTFLRGEGATIAEAEDACWARYERLTACPHDQGFERRHYVNGSGFCRRCGTWFGSDVTGFEPLPEYYEHDKDLSLLERALLGDIGAAAEIAAVLARADELPTREPSREAAPDQAGPGSRPVNTSANRPPGRPTGPPRRHPSLSPANVALTDQILAALDDDDGLPISTPGLLDKLGLRGHHNTVLRLLNRLARLGEVKRIELEDMRCLYWQRWRDDNARAPR